jgi:hypothetical protein
MLNIHADERFLHAGYRPVAMLYPFWGAPPEDPRNPAAGRFDNWVASGKSVFRLTALEDADLAVIPMGWEDARQSPEARTLVDDAAARARKAGTPLVVFFWNDSAEPVPLDDAIVLRTSYYRSARARTEFAMPAWSEDLVHKYLGGQQPWRPKSPRPVVGFCGWAGPAGTTGSAGPLGSSLTRHVKQSAHRVANLLGVRRHDTTRDHALRLLARSGWVEANLVLRDRYLGGPTILHETQDPAVIRQLRLEFVQNMVDSDYVLCVRGTGNYSYRLYETLSCGRIPVFVNTDCGLPFDFEEDWRQYCVWVEERDLETLPERIAAFHAGLSPAQFVELQDRCRRFWEEKLSPEGFFRNFYRHLLHVDLAGTHLEHARVRARVAVG